MNKHKSNKIKENSQYSEALDNGTDHNHSKSCCDQSSPARRTIKLDQNGVQNDITLTTYVALLWPINLTASSKSPNTQKLLCRICSTQYDLSGEPVWLKLIITAYIHWLSQGVRFAERSRDCHVVRISIHGNHVLRLLLLAALAPVPLSIFRSNSKFDESSKHSSVKYTITTIFCTRHDSVTVVTCAKYRCDRSSIFETKAFWIFIEFRIRSKYA